MLNVLWVSFILSNAIVPGSQAQEASLENPQESARLYLKSLEMMEKIEAHQTERPDFESLGASAFRIFPEAWAARASCLISGYEGVLVNGSCRSRKDSTYSEDRQACLKTGASIPCNPQVFGKGVCIDQPPHSRWTQRCGSLMLERAGVKGGKKPGDRLNDAELVLVADHLRSEKIDLGSVLRQVNALCHRSLENKRSADYADCKDFYTLAVRAKFQGQMPKKAAKKIPARTGGGQCEACEVSAQEAARLDSQFALVDEARRKLMPQNAEPLVVFDPARHCFQNEDCPSGKTPFLKAYREAFVKRFSEYMSEFYEQVSAELKKFGNDQSPVTHQVRIQNCVFKMTVEPRYFHCVTAQSCVRFEVFASEAHSGKRAGSKLMDIYSHEAGRQASERMKKRFPELNPETSSGHTAYLKEVFLGSKGSNPSSSIKSVFLNTVAEHQAVPACGADLEKQAQASR